MNNEKENLPILLYQPENGEVELQVKLHDETLWLSLNQLAQLFGRDKSVVAKHLKSIFKEQELEQDSVVAKFATTATDNKIYQVDYYNLDAIISVGYRVNSKQGTKFRQWSNRVLKEYLAQGFSLNKYRLQEKGISELTQAVELLHKTLASYNLLSEEGHEVVSIILSYAKTWNILLAFDQDKLQLPQNLHRSTNVI